MVSSIRVLGQSELFAGLSTGQSQSLARLAELVTVEPGAPIFSAGEPADHLCVVLEGLVELQMPVPVWWGIDTPYRKITAARPGQVIGWSALVEPYLYSLTAITRERSVLACFEAAAVRQTLHADQTMGTKVMAQLLAVVSRRLGALAEAVVAQRAVLAAQIASGSEREPAYS